MSEILLFNDLDLNFLDNLFDLTDSVSEEPNILLKFAAFVFSKKGENLKITKDLEFSNKEDRLQLEHLYSVSPTDPQEKIETVKQLFVSSGSAKVTKAEIENYTLKAFSVLEAIKISEDNKNALKVFGNDLMSRSV